MRVDVEVPVDRNSRGGRETRETGAVKGYTLSKELV
jgi:hypothetical protein